jgi:hypothetical protein
VMSAPTLFSSRALARVISGSWIPRRMEDARFFHQQANRCYQLAWQCFDLTIGISSMQCACAYCESARVLAVKALSTSACGGVLLKGA